MYWLCFGEISICDRCGKEKVVDEGDLPLLMPNSHEPEKAQ